MTTLKKNMVVYIGAGTTTFKKTRRTPERKQFYTALHGYTYNPEVEGKKQLKKNVPATMGYWTSSTTSSGIVVNQQDIIAGYSSSRDDECEAWVSLLEQLQNYISSITKEVVIEKKEEVEYDVEWTRILFIPDSPFFYRVMEMTEGRKGKCDDVLFKRIKVVQDFFKPYMPVTKNVDVKVAFVKGGLGAKRLGEEMGLADVMTLWGDHPECYVTATPLKEYENPETGLPKIISGNRWYFRTGKGTDYWDEIEGYRRYQFGKVEKGKHYYGKLTPDVTYSALFVKEPIPYFDKLFNFTEERTDNPRELMCTGNMQCVTSKGVARLIDSYPGVRKGKDLVVPFVVGTKEDPTLVELIDPPGLSFMIVESMDRIDLTFRCWKNRDENNRYGEYQEYFDITDKFFVKEANKKGDIKLKLNPAFKPSEAIIRHTAQHPKAVCPVPIMLSIGYDVPERNCFNSITDPEVKVWLNLDYSNDRCLIYRTIIETSDWIYVFTSASANVRVLNKKELGESK
ncbi:hypothetical protein [Photobacterium phage PDCC-1]|uniref:Uncharacterized protein n=1 Tax=Photobacterium phage PDCC-1 TaxID=2664246 RepID=A0A6B9J4X7_9CAUD|nr:ribonuclease [Photobacterium phage PDCC-1]QGZ14498.1 hypothetical protein [Photobacterium phage PDCC-1]